MEKKQQGEKQSTEGLTVKKSNNFSEWYTQVLEKAELVDLRLDIKGFPVIRPWAALTIEKKNCKKRTISQLLCPL